MLTTIFVILLTNSVQSFHLNFDDPFNNFQKCLTAIANQYFTDKITIIVDLENMTYSNSDSLQNFNYPKIEFDSYNFDTLDSIKSKTNNYILSYHDLDQLNETLAQLKSQVKSWNSRGKYLVKTVNPIDLEEVENILKLLWVYNIYKSSVVGQNELSTDVFSYDFVNSHCGKKLKAEKVNTCQNGVMVNLNKLYGKTISNNLCNNTLKTFWVPARPFIIDYKLEKNPGIFVSFIKLLGERSNISIVFVDNPSRYDTEVERLDDHAVIAEDFNKDYGEICIALIGLEYAKCVKLYDCTVPAHHERLYWILPKPRKNPFWKSIVTPFSILTWIVLCVVLFFATVMFWCMSYRQDEHLSFQSIVRCAIFAFRVNLGESDNLFPKTFNFRMFFVIFSTLSVILDTYYQGKLFQFLTNPGYEKGINSLDDILDSGLPYIFKQGFAVLFLFKDDKSEEVYDRFIPSNLSLDENLYNAVIRKDHLTITTGGQISLNPHLKESFNTLEIYFFYSTLLVKRDHVLLERLNEIMQRVIESGFFGKWISDIELEYFKQPLVDVMEGVFKLTINHLQGAFVVLGVGYLLAFMVFAMELLRPKKFFKKLIGRRF